MNDKNIRKSIKISLLLVLTLATWTIGFGQECRKSVIYYHSGKSTLTAEHKNFIDSLLSSLNPDSTYLIEIQGHTDQWGTHKRNELLSDKRRHAVVKYISKKKPSNVVLISNGFGETRPISKKDKENRRVNIYILPINSDRTISIYSKGTPSAELKIPAEMFNNCGVCDTFPTIRSMNSTEKRLSKGQVRVTVSTPCEFDLRCYSAVFRFPKDYFEQNDEIKAAAPIYVNVCGSYSDSINLKENENFEVYFDTLTNEYVLTLECYRPEMTICCGTLPIFRKYAFILPKEIENPTTSFYMEKQRNTEDGPEKYDSLVTYINLDSFMVDPSRSIQDTIWGSGYLNGELILMEVPFKDIPRNDVWTERGFYDYTRIKVPLRYYKPLSFSDTNLVVKVARKIPVDSMGYYIPQFDYYIPMDSIKPNRFGSELLDYYFDLGIYDSGVIKTFKMSDLKVKYKKRKNTYKVNIRKTG